MPSDTEDANSLFGKIYSYDELQALEPASQAKHKVMFLREKPAHWPDDTEPDPGRWAFWLPEGWGQGLKTTNTGGSLVCYIGPPETGGKRYFHKPKVEKFVGYKLAERPPKEENEEKEKTIKNVKDSIPKWPDGDWLPKDWRICFRQLPSGLHKVYIPPGQDECFIYQQEGVKKYLAGEHVSLTPFGISKPMAERMAIAAEGQSADGKTKNKRKAERVASENDFEQRPSLKVLKVHGTMPSSSSSSLSTSVPPGNVKDLMDLMSQRGFSKDLELLSLQDAALEHGIFNAALGFYYQLHDKHNDRPCYQNIRRLTAPSPRLACSELYLFWSSDTSRWKIGPLNDDLAGLAYCCDQGTTPFNLQAPWMLLKEEVVALTSPGFQAPSNIKQQMKQETTTASPNPGPATARAPSVSEPSAKVPSNWPPDVEMDTGVRLDWLPAGWGQGFVVQNGKKKRVFVSPEGKRKWHKSEVMKCTV